MFGKFVIARGLLARGVGVWGVWSALVLSGAVSVTANAGFYLPPLSSGQYLLLSAPLSPRSQEECWALHQQFSEEHSQAALAHLKCLNEADDEGYAGTESSSQCSKRACQQLHNTPDDITERSREQVGICNERLRRYQEQQKREEQARRKQELERQERAAQRDAERNERSAQRAARQAEREAEDLAEEQRWEQEQAQRQARHKERRVQETSPAAGAPTWETVAPAPNTARERQQSSSSGKAREGEEKDYWALIKQVKDTAATGRLALEAIKNPFETAVGFAANEMNEALLNKGISAATGLPEHHDGTYEGMTAIVDEGRTHVPSTNPFAQQVSNLSFSAVKQVHQGALGEMEQVTKQIEAFEPRPAPPGFIFAPSPDPAAARLGNEEPIPEIVSDGVAPTGRGVYDANPFATAATETRYTDPVSDTSYTIPAGHTLYRDSSVGELRVVRLADASAAGDRPEAGEQSCSADGVGVVTPACERKRAKGRNPFAPAASR